MSLSSRVFVPAVMAGVAGLAFAACGGGTSVTTPAATPTTSARAGSGAGADNGGPPGVAGQLASINGTVLEIQDPQAGQTTVNLTSTTTITQTATVTSSALQSGQCVTATGTKNTSGGVSATNVTINLTMTTPDCSGGGAGGGAFFGGGGGGGAGFGRGGGAGAGGGTTRTTLSPAQVQQRLATLGVSDGKVTAISGNTVTVQVPPPPSTTTSTTRAGATRVRVTPLPQFTYNSSTQFSELKTASPSDLAVGQCVMAFGPSDSTGTVTAQRITIRPAGPNGCSTGLGGGRFGGGGQGGQLSAPAGRSGSAGAALADGAAA